MISSHHKRILTSLLLLPVLAGGLFMGGWFLFALILAASTLGMREFYGMFWERGTRQSFKLLGYAAGAALLLAAMYNSYGWMLGILVGTFWVGSLTFLGSYGRGKDNACFRETQILVLGVMYLPLTLHFALGMHPEELLLVLGAAFASDTGGYYAGTLCGKRRIWPRVSPKKSWEGSIGGFILCAAICMLAGVTFGNPETTIWAWLLLALLLNVASQMGDFFESALKRTQGVKDSGSALPGHGGLLDRIDSLLLVLPVYAAARCVVPFFL
ncbi:phosphatidate cytidylyltransferase [Oleidesulfovibrio sp.]|uniref:phosphatidate cytidylyltransferase n=1 Tax=Oleidesulfovibrio sp. TaxID=2909707 RepID=UPI003A87117A